MSEEKRMGMAVDVMACGSEMLEHMRAAETDLFRMADGNGRIEARRIGFPIPKAGEWDIDLVNRFQAHVREMVGGDASIRMWPDGTAYVIADGGDCRGSTLFAALSAWPRDDK